MGADERVKVRGKSRGSLLDILIVSLSVYQKWFAVSPIARVAPLTFVLAAVISIPYAIRDAASRQYNILSSQLFAAAFLVYVALNSMMMVGRINILHPIIDCCLIFFSVFIVPSFFRGKDIYRIFLYAYCFSAAAFIADFVWTNAFGFSLAKFFQFVKTEGFYEPFTRGPFLSPSGPAEEPGLMSSYLCAMFPLAFSAVMRAKGTVFPLVFFISHLLMLLALFSSATLVIFPLSLIVTLVASLVSNRNFRGSVARFIGSERSRVVLIVGLATFGVLIGGGLTALLSGEGAASLIDIISTKTSFSDNSLSVIERKLDMQRALSEFDDAKIFGTGLGYNSAMYKHVLQNMYLLFAAELGAVGLLLFVGFILSALFTVRKHFYVFWALLYGALHFIFVSDLWNISYLYVISVSVCIASTPRATVSVGRLVRVDRRRSVRTLGGV